MRRREYWQRWACFPRAPRGKRAAGGFQFATGLQPIRDSHHVNGLVGLGEVADLAEYLAVVRAVEVFGRDQFSDAIPGVCRNHQPTQHRLLCLDGLRLQLDMGDFTVEIASWLTLKGGFGHGQPERLGGRAD